MVKHTFYHVTPYAGDILKSGFKSEEQLSAEQKPVGIGRSDLLGGIEKTNSFTTDLKIARDFVDDFKLFIEASRAIDGGKLDDKNMCEFLRDRDTTKLQGGIDHCDIWESIQGKSKKVKVYEDAVANFYCYTRGGKDYLRLWHPGEFKSWKESGKEPEPIPRDVLDFHEEKIPEAAARQMYDEYGVKDKRSFESYFELINEGRSQDMHICVGKSGAGAKREKLLGLLRTYAVYRNGIGNRQTPSFILPSIGRFKDYEPSNIKILEVEVDIPLTPEQVEQGWREWKHEEATTDWRWNAPARFFRARNVQGVYPVHPEFKEVRVPPKFVKSVKVVE